MNLLSFQVNRLKMQELCQGKEATRVSYSIRLDRLWWYLAALIILMLFGNVLVACTSSFSCARFLPTISYVGCFRNHDRWFVLTLTLIASVLPIFYLSVHLRVKFTLSNKENLVMYFCTAASSVSLIIIGLVDELNGIHLHPMEYVHIAFSLTFVVVNFVWQNIVLAALERFVHEFDKKVWVKRANLLNKLLAIMTIITMLQWHFAYTIYSNFLVNENTEAISEWILVILASLVPGTFANACSDLTLTLK